MTTPTTSRRLHVLAALAVMVTVGSCSAGKETLSANPTSSMPLTSPSATLPPSLPTPPLAPHVRLELSASDTEGVVAAFGSVWASDHHGSVINRFDPTSAKSLASPRAGYHLGWPAAGPDAVWALGYGDGSVTRVDPNSNASTIFKSPYSQLCGLPAVTAHAIWIDVCGNDGFNAFLARIELTLHRATKTLPVGNGVASMIVVGSSIWAAIYDPPSLVQFDPDSGQVLRRVPLAGCPLLTPGAYGFGAIWVGQLESDDTSNAKCTSRSQVFRVDIASGRVSSVPSGEGPYVTTGDGYVWVSSASSPSPQIVTRVDPRTLKRQTWTQVSDDLSVPDGLAIADHTLWLVSFQQGEIWLISTR